MNRKDARRTKSAARGLTNVSSNTLGDPFCASVESRRRLFGILGNCQIGWRINMARRAIKERGCTLVECREEIDRTTDVHRVCARRVSFDRCYRHQRRQVNNLIDRHQRSDCRSRRIQIRQIRLVGHHIRVGRETREMPDSVPAQNSTRPGYEDTHGIPPPP
ncbi:hypothetical protein D3C72_1852690 [compost metagenome]